MWQSSMPTHYEHVDNEILITYSCIKLLKFGCEQSSKYNSSHMSCIIFQGVGVQCSQQLSHLDVNWKIVILVLQTREMKFHQNMQLSDNHLSHFQSIIINDKHSSEMLFSLINSSKVINFHGKSHLKRKKNCESHIAFIGYRREITHIYHKHAIRCSCRVHLVGLFYCHNIHQEKPRCLSNSLHIADIFCYAFFRTYDMISSTIDHGRCVSLLFVSLSH